jgi:capsular exopolysaccharide synthesis family protein
VPNLKGVTGILLQQTELADAVHKTDIDGLSLLPSGPIPPDPARLLESEKMKKLIEALAERYDIVILDSPPVLAVNDAIVLAGFTDGFISIVESARETYHALGREKEMYNNSNIKPLGVVLNKFHTKKFGSYYYNYYQKF